MSDAYRPRRRSTWDDSRLRYRALFALLSEQWSDAWSLRSGLGAACRPGPEIQLALLLLAVSLYLHNSQVSIVDWLLRNDLILEDAIVGTTSTLEGLSRLSLWLAVLVSARLALLASVATLAVSSVILQNALLRWPPAARLFGRLRGFFHPLVEGGVRDLRRLAALVVRPFVSLAELTVAAARAGSLLVASAAELTTAVLQVVVTPFLEVGRALGDVVALGLSAMAPLLAWARHHCWTVVLLVARPFGRAAAVFGRILLVLSKLALRGLTVLVLVFAAAPIVWTARAVRCLFVTLIEVAGLAFQRNDAFKGWLGRGCRSLVVSLQRLIEVSFERFVKPLHAMVLAIELIGGVATVGVRAAMRALRWTIRVPFLVAHALLTLLGLALLAALRPLVPFLLLGVRMLTRAWSGGARALAAAYQNLAIALTALLRGLLWPLRFAVGVIEHVVLSPAGSAARALRVGAISCLALAEQLVIRALAPFAAPLHAFAQWAHEALSQVGPLLLTAARRMRAQPANLAVLAVWGLTWVAGFSDWMARAVNRTTSSLHGMMPRVPATNFTGGQSMGALACVSIFGAIGIYLSPVGSTPGVEVVHWANAHMTRPALLPAMVEEFNATRPQTASGKRIKVRVVGYGSAEQVDDVLSRVNRNVPLDATRPDPTIITPSADHWVAHLNHQAGRTIVDPQDTRGIAVTWIGIVTYREMAECLGWPGKELGYADILALRQDPRGWTAYPCARAEWGRQPLVAYTDPLTSTTGRSGLYTLYAIATGKAPEDLTVDDVANPAVAGYVRDFQDVVDHYMPGTIPLNTKVHLGPRFGHFFLMPEDNLVHLYKGEERAVIAGVEVPAPPIERSMVMIYPKEGAAAHNHSANLVQAGWVTAEQREAAEQWIKFLQQQDQQSRFVSAGFRPAIDMAYGDPISDRFGLDPTKPTVTIDPDRVEPSAAEAILASWQEIKKPGVVTFVLDVSGSMQGPKLVQAKDGLARSLDSMSSLNHVGLLTFDDVVRTRVEVGLLAENKFAITSALESARVGGNTALYDAIKAAVMMTDAAPGAPTAIRGVVVLTDGIANRGHVDLDDLIRMSSRNESEIRTFSGFESATAVDVLSRPVPANEVIGVSLALNTEHRVLVFFIGIGTGADVEVGRLLAEATGAAFQGTTDKDLSAVIQEFGKYF